MTKVKCIYIDAKNQEVRFVEREIPVDTFLEDIPGYQKGMIIRSPFFSDDNRTPGIEHVLYYKEGVVYDPKDIPRYGFLCRTSHTTDEPFDPFIDNFTPICGNALLVSFNYDLKVGMRDKSKQAPPVDTPLSLDDAHQIVPEFTNGILWKLPDFTCMLNKSFCERGYELLLRVENEDLLHLHNHDQLTKPIQMHTSQIVSFAFNYYEVTIVTGRIESPEDKVRVVLYETERADLRQIAACILTAEKIPRWIQDRLQDFFFEKMVAERFLQKVHRQRKSAVQPTIQGM